MTKPSELKLIKFLSRFSTKYRSLLETEIEESKEAERQVQTEIEQAQIRSEQTRIESELKEDLMSKCQIDKIYSISSPEERRRRKEFQDLDSEFLDIGIHFWDMTYLVIKMQHGKVPSCYVCYSKFVQHGIKTLISIDAKVSEDAQTLSVERSLGFTEEQDAAMYKELLEKVIRANQLIYSAKAAGLSTYYEQAPAVEAALFILKGLVDVKKIDDRTERDLRRY